MITYSIGFMCALIFFTRILDSKFVMREEDEKVPPHNVGSLLAIVFVSLLWPLIAIALAAKFVNSFFDTN